MCGIGGIFRFDGATVTSEQLSPMAAAIAHRGPDNEGFFVDGSFGILHRRLSIIDLTPAANQPMATEDGRYVITYNGEVYNFKELRAELETKGHRFRSHSDTEVLLLGYAEWGTALVSRLNGMFAFAVWDKKERQLFLARDRYGIKPLYLFHADDILLFGSEVKQFLPVPKFRVDVDREALVEYFTFQNFLGERTLFKGVTMFPAGHYAQVNANGSISKTQYWDYDFAEEPIDARLATEQMNFLFDQAVSRNLVSDVPVGAYLSGGMDSAAITLRAARDVPNLRSFTIGFDLRSASGLELNFDERARAELISHHARTEHYQMVLKSGDMERCFSDLVWHLEEPRVGQCYPNFYASHLASKFVKVILGGTGGDELFGGYPWRYYRAMQSSSFDQYIDEYYLYWQRLIPNRIVNKMFEPISSDISHVWTKDIFKSVFLHHQADLQRPEDYVNHSLYFEAKTFLHGLFVVEDKLAMAHGVESRVPFMDNDLVEFAQKLPVSMKLREISSVVRIDENAQVKKREQIALETNDGKQIMRKAFAESLPPDIINAQKQGFSAPDASWFKGESLDFVRDRLWSADSPIFEYMSREVVQSVVGEHIQGKVNRRLLIWSLLYFDEWLRQFAGHPVRLA